MEKEVCKHLKRCKRCSKPYRTSCKFGSICNKCL